METKRKQNEFGRARGVGPKGSLDKKRETLSYFCKVDLRELQIMN